MSDLADGSVLSSLPTRDVPMICQPDALHPGILVFAYLLLELPQRQRFRLFPMRRERAKILASLGFSLWSLLRLRRDVDGAMVKTGVRV